MTYYYNITAYSNLSIDHKITKNHRKIFTLKFMRSAHIFEKNR